MYREVLTSAGVAPYWNPERYKRALQPRHREILAGVYRAMVDDCRAKGIPIIWVLIPRVGRPSDPAGHRALLEEARAASFSRIVDLTDAYDGLDPASLAVEPDDFHPNPSGHRLLARRLDAELGALPEMRRLWGEVPVATATQKAGPGNHGVAPGVETR